MNRQGQKNHLFIHKPIVSITFVIMIVVFALCAVLQFFLGISADTQEEAYNSLIEIGRQQSAYLEDKINVEFDCLETFAATIADPALGKDANSLRPYMQIVQRIGEFSLVGVVNTKGLAITTMNEPVNIADRSYFQQALAGQRAIEYITTGKLVAAPRMIIAVPIVKNDEITGVVYGSFSNALLSNLLYSSVYGGETYSCIVTAEGKHVASSKKSHSIDCGNIFQMLQDTTIEHSFSAEQLKLDLSEKRSNTFSILVENQRRYIVYRPLPFCGFQLFAGVAADIVEQTNTYIDRRALVLSGELIALGILMVFAVIVWQRQLKKAEVKYFKELSETDPLTHLLNRTAAACAIDAYLKHEGANGTHTLAFIDLDNFKGINDTLGHQAGDQALISFASCLRTVFRSTDVIARLGGDEFIVLIKEAASAAFWESLPEKISFALQKTLVENSVNPPLSCSIGVAAYPKDGGDFETLCKKADRALYYAKATGKSRICVYEEPEMRGELST
ncbi:MAG: sensor domain-containing diguanylate cyclase [Clostridia bacterium]